MLEMPERVLGISSPGCRGGLGYVSPPPHLEDFMCSEVLYILLRLFRLSLSTHVVQFISTIIVHTRSEKFIFKSHVLVVPLLVTQQLQKGAVCCTN